MNRGSNYPSTMIVNRRIYLLILLLPLLVNGCKNANTIDKAFHFTQVDKSITHIEFNNLITESDSANIFTNEYMYNGSGVGIGDFNNDGLQDVFFCGSMVSSKLYINKGNFVFEDITDKAAIHTNTWCTGVSIVDINNDGFSDIYVCTSHSADTAKRKNLLFINDGKLHFTEQAAAYGLADTGYATQAAFFDYDKDGDIDMYLLNHRLYSHTANDIQLKDTSGNSPAQDRLYRNNGIPAGQTHPVFQDVTRQCGLGEDGYGLGLVITDVNNDNWPDIYVANDYIGNDLLWLNNHDGTFSNVIASSLRHQSFNSMGVDAADINNDGLPDIAVVDMLPENNERKKMMANATSQEKFDMQQRFGYQPSYVRNMLQLNNGNRIINTKAEPFFSEIGQLAGMAETDWSWSILMADFDNDGWKDIHVTNGLGKDVTNNDYTTFRNAETNTDNYTFGTTKPKKSLSNNAIGSLRKNIDDYGSVQMNNYLLHNNGNLGFSNISKQAGLAIPSISNGAAYADLDNDGDLDLVINNINQQAFIWRNESRKTIQDSSYNFLTLQLTGPAGNLMGLGSQVTLYNSEHTQFAEQSPVRGFCSSVDTRLHFGVESLTVIDSIKIKWPDNKVQILKSITTNQVLKIQYKDAIELSNTNTGVSMATIFSESNSSFGIHFKHAEAQNFDFGNHQPLPQKYSQLGPCIATGDINGDGREDFFVGGAANQSGKLFIQQFDGNFTSSNLMEGNKSTEDLGAVFFDADRDKDLDLLITGGSFEFSVANYNQPGLYKNDGKGKFTLAEKSLPVITDVTNAVAVADYDGDGDNDLFIGGRLSPEKYPQSPRSYILRNDGGDFTDVTKIVNTSLEFAGMITSALFTDFNNDTKPDLIICGEFTSIRFFKNINGKLEETTDATGLVNMKGLWRSLQQSDIDHDGDMDYIAGNMGNNNNYHIAPNRPMMLYSKDIDNNGFAELIPANYIKDRKDQYELFPALDRNQLAEQLPAAKKKYLLHADYSIITMNQLMADYGAENWTSFMCETTSSFYIENLGNGKFKAHVLPVQAQFAPVNTIVAEDIDADGNTDVVMAGNEYQTSLNTGRYDASYGLILKGNGKGDFTSVNILRSGLIMDGDIKNMKMISIKNSGRLLLVAPNDSELKAYLLNNNRNN